MVLTDSPLKRALKLILKILIEEYPLFRLKYLGYEAYIHQAELFYKLVLRHPIRVLIADEIGLGKTIETLLVTEWSLHKGIFQNGKVLILVPRSIIGQWKMEARQMGLHPVTDIKGFEKFISETHGNKMVFIFKIDTAKRDEYCNRLLEYNWDLIVVDEVHKLGLDTQRLNLVKRLVEKNSHASIIFLSATPHKGNDEHYLQLLTLLDLLKKSVMKNVEEFYYQIIDALVFRRSKKQVNAVYEEDKVFVDAELITLLVTPTDDERKYIEELDKLTRDLVMRCQDTRLKYAIGLLAMIIDKRGLSSPYAGLKTFNKILNSIEQTDIVTAVSEKVLESLEEYGEEEYISEEELDTVIESALDVQIKDRNIKNIVVRFIKSFGDLIKLTHKVLERNSKLARLQMIIEDHLNKGEKIIIFTEFADTAEYIYNKLAGKLSCEIMKITGEDFKFKGSEFIDEIRRWLEKQGPRILISTDVASEGLNLQYANVVVNFELPWSLVKLEQRTGRVWRLGQKNDVKIYLMVLNHSFEEKIFNALYQKLAKSVRAHIVPSTLIALKGQEGLELPPSGVFESRNITPYKLWESYKTQGENALVELIEEYLRELSRLSERLRKVKLYDDSSLNPFVINVIKTDLEKLTGFTSKNDFHKTLCDIAYKLGESRCDEYTLNKILKEAKHVDALANHYLY
jgi:SNF2 family DNA or RNA helicase